MPSIVAGWAVSLTSFNQRVGAEAGQTAPQQI